jgi:cell division protein FtsN
MRKILWRAAVIVPLLAVLTVIPFTTDIFRSKVETTTMNPLVTAEFENNKKAIDEEKPVKTEEVNINDFQPAPPPVEASLPAAEAEMPYCLITGSFRLQQNAYNQADMLKDEGYDPEILEAPNGFYRVSAVRCKDLNSALQKADSISKKFPGTWVKKI